MSYKNKNSEYLAIFKYEEYNIYVFLGCFIIISMNKKAKTSNHQPYSDKPLYYTYLEFLPP